MGGFLSRCFGCALTGDAEAETLFLLQGDGGSGKTTLVEAVASMLGDYSAKLTFDSFCTSKHGRGPGAASPDLIRLRGSRLAYASEGDQSARLDAGVVKTLTGNEPITARALYAEPITFPQTWKLWLVSNFDPKADSEDSGIWRRMLKLHFAAIPAADRDPAVKRMLTTDAGAQSALLAWAVAGCLDWQKRGGGRIGLAPPDAVQAATDTYRIRQDTMAQWWDDLLAEDAKLDPYGKTTRKALREHYEQWCQDNGAVPVHAKRFIAYLEARGLQIAPRTSGGRGWVGLEMIA
jgi:putative DNA primase/helicase